MPTSKEPPLLNLVKLTVTVGQAYWKVDHWICYSFKGLVCLRNNFERGPKPIEQLFMTKERLIPFTIRGYLNSFFLTFLNFTTADYNGILSEQTLCVCHTSPDARHLKGASRCFIIHVVSANSSCHTWLTKHGFDQITLTNNLKASLTHLQSVLN